ncbi:3-hydroxyacyl-CoA dehydrogenase NAD-binding domain-containing protein [Chloroflexota bacterium]
MSIEKIAVIGSGLMGHGIAQVVATSGQEVSLIDISDDLLKKAMQKIEASLSKFAEKGRLKETPQNILKRVSTTTNFAGGVSDADFVIEAVSEDINLKKKILSEVDKHAPQHAILATNTTGLSVTVIAEAVKRKEKVIGMHWMNPAQIMRLIEIIKSEYTDEEVLQSTLELCKRYGKETVIAQKDVWQFLAARARAGWSIEVNLIYWRKEADFKELDAVAKYKLGLPMGEFEYFDLTGAVDIRTRGLASVTEILKIYPEFEPWPAFLATFRYLAKELWMPMSEKGLSGLKTGKGFYQYPDGKYVKPEIPEELAGKVDPIQLLAPAMNTAAWCVSNGVGSVDDVNRSFRLAFGWPKGIFEFVDEYGIENIVSVLKAKAEKAPEWLKEFYKVDPLLVSWPV